MSEFVDPQAVESQQPEAPRSFTTIPTCLQYHPLSELHGRTGYYPNITAEQLAAVNSLLERIRAKDLIAQFVNEGQEHTFLKLLRFLRARKFNVDNAFSMIESDILWRSEGNRGNLRNMRAAEVLGCDSREVCKYFPTWIQGYDKQSRPISWRQFGKFEIWSILNHTTMENLIKFHAWETEQSLRMMNQLSVQHQINIETFVLIIDAGGWTVSLATSDAFTFIKGMVGTDSDHYPERLGMMMIINAPFMLSWAWKIIQAFLDDVTKAKIKIYSSPSEWQPELFKFIDRDQAPIMYGGTQPNPEHPEDFIKSMDPPTADASER